VAFCVLGFSQLLYAFACRSREVTAFGLGVLTNRQLVGAAAISAGLQAAVILLEPLHPVFGVEAYPTPAEWGLIAGLALVPAAVVDLSKLVLRRFASEETA
jgi:magnesium-transporting ATPase (P-type)